MAVDILEISPTLGTGMKKVVVVGDVFSRYMLAVAMEDESAKTIHEVLFTRWISVFGPPVRLLSDRGTTFLSGAVRCLCELIGTKKVSTSPCPPQMNGMVEHFNSTLVVVRIWLA